MATFNRRGYKNSKSESAQKGGKSQTAEVFESLDSTANKSEQWILKNQNIILTFIGVISLSVLSYLGYERFISDPNEKEAISELNKAQYFFELALVSNESDSLFKLALNGGEGKYGFLDISTQFSGTKSANIANYYAGVSYLKLKEYEKAIEYLSKFDSDDEILGPTAIGAIGDAFADIDQTEDALDYYEKAANKKNNEFTTPLFLFKAGRTALDLGQFSKAEKIFTQIKDDYPSSDIGKDIDKYIYSAKYAQ